MLFFRVLHGSGILYLVVSDLCVFQVRLDVLCLETLYNIFGKFTSFLFVPIFGVLLSRFI